MIKVETLIEALVLQGLDRNSLIAYSDRLILRHNGLTILLAEFENGELDINTGLAISWFLGTKEGGNDE